MPLNLSTFQIPALVEEVMSELEPIIKRSNLSVRAVMPRVAAAAAGATGRRSSRSS